MRLNPFRMARVAGQSLVLVLVMTASSIVHSAGASGRAVDGYRTIEWTDLMPKEDLDAFLNPPESLNEIADGSEQDQIDSQFQTELEPAGDSAYQRALVSTRVVKEFDGQAIRLPGFIVPLEFGDGDQQVTRFFLVPYFGACIHVPPPPPNQIIYAEFDQGFKLESLYDPFWISGKLRTTLIENETATAAYAVKVDSIEPYDD